MLLVSAIGVTMAAAANLVEVAALVGDTARATMLSVLMGGQSLTAKELAYYATVSPSTASDHLSKLVAAQLLTVTREGRFSYYRIASPADRDNAGEHESRRRHTGATSPSAAVSKRRGTAFCPELLRPPGWSGRSRCCRCTCGHGTHRTHR